MTHHTSVSDIRLMIVGFRSKLASDIYHGFDNQRTRRMSQQIITKTRRLMDQLNASHSIDLMRKPPGNRLEKLSGNLKDFWSVRINDQWRLIFRWQNNNDACDVDIVDYH